MEVTHKTMTRQKMTISATPRGRGEGINGIEPSDTAAGGVGGRGRGREREREKCASLRLCACFSVHLRLSEFVRQFIGASVR